jgi:hypothetical protein
MADMKQKYSPRRDAEIKTYYSLNKPLPLRADITMGF